MPEGAGRVQVRVLSLDPEDCMKVLAVQQVNATPDSLLLLDSPALGADGTEEGAGAGALFLHIGALRSVEPSKGYFSLSPQ